MPGDFTIAGIVVGVLVSSLLILLRAYLTLRADFKRINTRLSDYLAGKRSSLGLATTTKPGSRLSQLLSSFLIQKQTAARHTSSLSSAIKDSSELVTDANTAEKAVDILWRNFSHFSTGVVVYLKASESFSYAGSPALTRLLPTLKEMGAFEPGFHNQIKTEEYFGENLNLRSCYIEKIGESGICVVFTEAGIESNLKTTVSALCAQISASLAVASQFKEQKDLYFGLSHDLKAPGNTAYFALKQLQARDEHEKNLMAVIEGSLKEQQQLISDMLDLAKLRAGHLSSNPESTSLNKLLEDIKEGFSAWQFGKRSILQLTTPQIEVFAKIDQRQIKRILANFITNAYKYADHGVIHLELRVNQGAATVMVVDSGPGLGEEQQKKLFKAFSRVTENSGIEGVGLGLYICSILAQTNKCTLAYTNKPQSTFSIEIPIEKVKEIKKESNYQFKNKILLIDDDPRITRTIVRQLRDISDELDVANDIETVKKLLEEKQFDLVISDYNIGEDTPHSFLDEIKDTPLIILTGESPENVDIPCLRVVDKGAEFDLIKRVVMEFQSSPAQEATAPTTL